MRVIDKVAHMVSSLEYVKVKSESFLEFLQALLLEARKPRVVHQLYQVAELSIVLSYRQIRLHGLCYEELVGLGGHSAAHDIDEFLGQLEVRTLETHVFAWGPVKDKTEIDVNNVAPVINHDVAVMTVLDLQNVAHH